MNIPQLAADIARRVPDMAKDSLLNNAQVIEGLILEAMKTACPRCNGQGALTKTIYADAGNGYSEPFEVKELCEDCNGSGMTEPVWNCCPMCGHEFEAQ